MNKINHLIIASTFVASSVQGAEYSKKFPDDAPSIPTKTSPDKKVSSGTQECIGARVYYGPTYLEHKTVDQLSITGPATLEDIIARQPIEIMGPAKIKSCALKDLKISGPLNARQVTIITLNVNGPVRLERVTVDGKTLINGPLHAEECNFKSPISIATDKLILDHSTAENIEVRSNTSSLDKPQRVILTNKAIVNGHITFEAGNGIVVLSKGAILKGEVKGGKKIDKEKRV